MDSARPEDFLVYLQPLLMGSTGCVKSTKDMNKFIQQMKIITFFPHKCICIQILKATAVQADEILMDKFLASGGWAILNSWLADSKKAHNIPLSMHLLELFKRIPVTVEMLKSGTVGKLVKQLSKAETPSELKDLAIEVLQDWMNLIKMSAAKDDHTKGKSKGEKRAGAKLPEEPIEKRAKPANLYRLGTKEVPPTSKPKIVQESTGFMTAVKNSAASQQGKRQLPKKTPIKPQPSLSQGKTAKTPEEEVKKFKDENKNETPVEPDSGNGEKETKKKRKSVSWAPDIKLMTIHYFELDENERINVNRRKSFTDALQSDRMRDRQILESSKLQASEDLMEESFQWIKPKSLHGFIEVVKPGASSKEKVIQAEREQQNLAFFFLSKESLQESPFEPDSEQTTVSAAEPREIPLNDQSSSSEASSAGFNRTTALPSHSSVAPTTAKSAAQSLLDTMKKSSQAPPYRQHALFERAFDPQIQSQISTENLKQILQSTTQLASFSSMRPPRPPAPTPHGSQSRYASSDARTVGSGSGLVQYPIGSQKDYQGPYRNQQRADYRQRPYDDYSRTVPMTNNTRRSSGDDSWRR